MSTKQKSIPLNEAKDNEIFSKFMDMNNGYRTNILYNWIVQRVVSRKLFAKMVEYMIEQGVGHEDIREHSSNREDDSIPVSSF